MYPAKEDHTMRPSSLERYLKMKVHKSLLEIPASQIIVRGYYDRNDPSANITHEKNDKPTNYKRPTVSEENGISYVNCFPGPDYVRHYELIIGTYFQEFSAMSPDIQGIIPERNAALLELSKSNIADFPRQDVVVIGNVQHIHKLTNNSPFINTDKPGQDFIWSEGRLGDNKIALLGCKFNFWGDIGGAVVQTLQQFGHGHVVYVGKLGGLKENYIPNQVIAISESSMVDGSEVNWKSMFNKAAASNIAHGLHIGLPSVLMETKEWLQQNNAGHFVDPEIGRMAAAARECGIEFSNLHLVSDNLVIEHEHDLSNERKQDVQTARTQLFNQIGKILEDTILKRSRTFRQETSYSFPAL